MLPDGLAHSALDAIPHDSSAQSPAYSDPNTGPSRFRGRAYEVESCQQPRKVPSPCLIYVLKIGMFQQLYRLGKPQPAMRPGIRRMSRRRLFRNGVHGTHTCDGESTDKNACGYTTRGIQASRRRACVPWRGGVTKPLLRSLFSYGYETRASSSGDDGWVETCASAWRANNSYSEIRLRTN